MLSHNIKTIRQAKGLSQDELSIKLNVVCQTISKWERGLSVPDSEMLITLSDILETPVSTLLGENVTESKDDELKIIAQKLADINHHLVKHQERRRKLYQSSLILICTLTIGLFIILSMLNSPYLNWNYSEPDTAVLGVILHGLEWVFIRLAPIIILLSIIGLIYIRKRI